MNIQDFINTKHYSSNVKKGGLKYLLDSWERICQRIPYSHTFLFDEYLNDLLTRKVIGEIIENCEIDRESIDKLKQLDAVFRSKTIEVNKSLWPNDENKYDNGYYWFYYRIPPGSILDWFRNEDVLLSLNS
jgi:hypothetical protein